MLARRLSLRFCVFLGTLTFALGGAQQAFAAKPPSSSKLQARERQAKTACLSGDYAKGISILAELFVETNNPVHLFNQGRCYEQNVRYVEAAERFREYLRKDQDIPAAVRANVEKHIADCNAAIAQSQPRAAIDVAPQAAWAAGKNPKERAAKTACLAGEYAKGVSLLAELYVSTGQAIHLFNQGRCFEQNGLYEEAIVRFREYERKNADAGRSPDAGAAKHIADCHEQLLEKNKLATPTSVPAKEGTAVQSALPAAQAVARHPSTTSSSPDLLVQREAPTVEPLGEERPFYKAWWFWTTLGAVVAGSVTAYLLARRTPDPCDGLGMRCKGVTGEP
jgi:tetratricopeptide (TPR) repeat protein